MSLSDIFREIINFFKTIPGFFKTKKVKEKIVEKPVGQLKKKKTGLAPMILHSPHIAEKPTHLAEKNQYVFKVFPRANKTEIKRAVEETYGVNVLSVKIIKVPRRKRMVRRKAGWRKGYTKAIVRVKEGQRIEILPR